MTYYKSGPGIQNVWTCWNNLKDETKFQKNTETNFQKDITYTI